LENIVSPKVLRIEGRAGDTVELKRWKRGWVYGSFVQRCKQPGNSPDPPICRKETLEVKLVVSPSWKPEDEQQLRSNMARMIGDMPVEFILCKRETLLTQQIKI
jgi:hypothetical protein